MADGDIHTVPHGDGWANRVEGNESVSRNYESQSEAQADGREWALEQGVDHYLHGRDVQIRERNTDSRSRDPRDSDG